ncbi:Ig-like domain-containing protein, partial [Aeromicrobium sp.]|uniref:Ig-like domain-containing protein n=1 Tax=Aeromicrobium sp. TaxID=1871063 RepID=UPI003C460566
MNFRSVLITGFAALVLTGCSGSKVKEAVTPEDPVSLSASVKDKAKGVTVDTIVTADAEHGSISDVTLATSNGKSTVKGRVSGTQWVASERLEPGREYKLTVKGSGDDDKEKTLERTFTTEKLS